jgi:hypothetical protein
MSNETRATRLTTKMLFAILTGTAAAAMLFALATDLGVLYLIFGASIGFSVYQALKRRSARL